MGDLFQPLEDLVKAAPEQVKVGVEEALKKLKEEVTTSELIAQKENELKAHLDTIGRPLEAVPSGNKEAADSFFKVYLAKIEELLGNNPVAAARKRIADLRLRVGDRKHAPESREIDPKSAEKLQKDFVDMATGITMGILGVTLKDVPEATRKEFLDKLKVIATGSPEEKKTRATELLALLEGPQRQVFEKSLGTNYASFAAFLRSVESGEPMSQALLAFPKLVDGLRSAIGKYSPQVAQAAEGAIMGLVPADKKEMVQGYVDRAKEFAGSIAEKFPFLGDKDSIFVIIIKWILDMLKNLKGTFGKVFDGIAAKAEQALKTIELAEGRDAARKAFGANVPEDFETLYPAAFDLVSKNDQRLAAITDVNEKWKKAFEIARGIGVQSQRGTHALAVLKDPSLWGENLETVVAGPGVSVRRVNGKLALTAPETILTQVKKEGQSVRQGKELADLLMVFRELTTQNVSFSVLSFGPSARIARESDGNFSVVLTANVSAQRVSRMCGILKDDQRIAVIDGSGAGLPPEAEMFQHARVNNVDVVTITVPGLDRLVGEGGTSFRPKDKSKNQSMGEVDFVGKKWSWDDEKKAWVEG